MNWVSLLCLLALLQIAYAQDTCACAQQKCSCCSETSLPLPFLPEPFKLTGCVNSIMHFENPPRANVALVFNGVVLARQNFTQTSPHSPLCHELDFGIQMCVGLSRARIDEDTGKFTACPMTEFKWNTFEILKHNFKCFEMDMHPH